MPISQEQQERARLIYHQDIETNIVPMPRRRQRAHRNLSRTTITATIAGALLGVVLILLVASGVMSSDVLAWLIGVVGFLIAMYAVRGRRTR